MDAFLPAAAGEIRCRGLDRAAASRPVRVGAAAAGRAWRPRFFDHPCPDAVRVLDFYHAAEEVRGCRRALFPAAAPARWWAGKSLHDRKHDGPCTLLSSRRTWASVGEGRRLGQYAAATLAYFERRAALLQYPEGRAGGWPIGSGAVESGRQQGVEERRKGPGMFWEAAQVNPMLSLRDAAGSGRWDAAWADLTRRLRRGRYPVAMLHAKT